MRPKPGPGPSLAVRLGLLDKDPAPVAFTPSGIWQGFVADFGARKKIMGSLGPIVQHAPKPVQSGYNTMMATAADAESIFGLFGV